MDEEIHHRMSQEASNALFEVARKWFFKLFKAKFDEGIAREPPQFVHLRRQLYKKKVPPVHLEVSYQNKETDEIVTLKDLESTPTSRFPPNQFVKLYESAYVKVFKSNYYFLSSFLLFFILLFVFQKTFSIYQQKIISKPLLSDTVPKRVLIANLPTYLRTYLPLIININGRIKTKTFISIIHCRVYNN